MTLVELLVAMTLAALLLTILARFAASAYRISHAELERSFVETTILQLSDKLRGDLSVSAPAGVSLSVDGTRALLHPVTMSDVGTVVYQPRLLLWHWDSAGQEVSRKQCASYPGLTFDGTPFRASEAVLLGLPGSSDFQLANKFPGVSKFQLTSSASINPPFIGSPLELEVEAPLPLSTTRKFVILRQTLYLRNSGT